MARVAALAAVLLVAACSGGGTFSRGLFTGYVMGQTPETVESKVGKPASVQSPDADHQTWVYEKKTFDPDNGNAEDARTSVYFERKDGQLVVAEVRYI
jgi:hypothetical protein